MTGDIIQADPIVPGGDELVELEPMLAAVRFHGAYITLMTAAVCRSIGHPLDPLVGWDLRCTLKQLVENAKPLEGEPERFRLGELRGQQLQLDRNRTGGWAVRFAEE